MQQLVGERGRGERHDIGLVDLGKKLFLQFLVVAAGVVGQRHRHVNGGAGRHVEMVVSQHDEAEVGQLAVDHILRPLAEFPLVPHVIGLLEVGLTVVEEAPGQARPVV